MKNHFLSMAFGVIAQLAFSQTTDTTFLSVTQENGSLERQHFMDQYDYVFGTKQPTKLLLKLDLVPVLGPLGAFALDDEPLYYGGILGEIDFITKAELGLEWKAFPALSLSGSVMAPTRGSAYFKGHYRGAGWRIEPRWYYKMPRHIRSGRSASNVSGNYISGAYQNYAQRDLDRKPSDAYMHLRYQAISLRYGIQRRLFRYGFIDMSIGAGYQWANYQSKDEYRTTDKKDHGLFLETRVAAGLALGSPRTPKSDVILCDVLRCFQEDRHLWKISLAKALRINQAGVFMNPKASYEQKLGSTPFSVETELEVFLSTYPGYGDGLNIRKYGAGINVQPRWYFLQKYRIAKGKSGNNLAGVFAGMMGGYRWKKEPGITTIFWNDPPNTFYLAPHLGVQHRLFKNGFVNFKFGVLYDIGFSIRNNWFPDPKSFLSELQMGFAF